MKNAHCRQGLNLRPSRFACRGSGLLVALAALVIAMLVPVMLARHRQGSRASIAVMQSKRGEVLFDVGRAAIAEAWWQIERRASDPSDSLFTTLRSPQSSTRSFPIDVPHVVDELAQNPSLAGAELKDGVVEATLSPLVTLGNDPPEGTAAVLLQASVAHVSGTPVRTVRERRELRVLLISVPRPYDAYSLVVNDAADLIGTDTNAWIEEARQEIVRLADRARQKIQAVGGSVDDLPAATKRLLDPPPDLTTDLSHGLHLFPAHCALASRSSTTCDLSQLRLLPVLEETRREIAAARLDYERLDASDPTDEQGLRALANKAAVLSNADRKLLMQVAAFQDTWAEVGDADADALSGASARLDVAEWSRRSTFQFSGAGAASRFLAMLDAYAQENPPRSVSGTILLDNQAEPLRMGHRRISGRLVIVATGSVDLTDVVLNDPATDLLVVQAQGPIRASGRIQCALIPRGGLILDSDTVLQGSLAMDRVSGADHLVGFLAGDIDRYQTGSAGAQRPGMLWAFLAPWADSREVDVK